jgi:hypothetical protein
MRRYLRLTQGLLLLLLAACDPCQGVGSCGDPSMRFEGRVFKQYPAEPVEGVRVEFVRTRGVVLDRDTLRGLTDRHGRFRLEGAASEDGTATGRLILHPPAPLAPLTVDDVELVASRAQGDVRYLGDWKIPYPYLPYEVHFYRVGTGAPVQGMEVEFRRTGGIPVSPDTFRVTSDGFGNVKLRPRTDVPGVLHGELLVYPLPPLQPYVIPNLRMQTFVAERIDSTLVRSGVGLAISYGGALVWQGTGQPVANAEVEFRRTGGVMIQPERFTSRSDGFGTFFLRSTPLVNGEVVGDLVVRPPAPYREQTVRNLRLPVMTSGDVTFLGYIGIARVEARTNEGS